MFATSDIMINNCVAIVTTIPLDDADIVSELEVGKFSAKIPKKIQATSLNNI